MSSTPSPPAETSRGASVGRVLIVVGGALAALSSWLNWGAKTRQLGAARTAYTIPAKFVIDSGSGPGSPGLSLGVVVLLLGLIVAAIAFAPSPWWKIAGLVAGAAVAVTGFLYVYQVRKVVHDANLGRSVRDFISIGPYLAVIGGLLAVVGGAIALIPPGFWSSLTSEEAPEEEGTRPAGEPRDE
ncbi:MAG TPA: hypothetical protein VKH17_03485 [Acidimicrobiia bacterium]|jgi:hypothetical protein|nr:hypothetical protein [Acidimicrobiia bacterium]HMF83511.1 hypothetical protein [Acidimicrobiia bacterium]